MLLLSCIHHRANNISERFCSSGFQVSRAGVANNVLRTHRCENVEIEPANVTCSCSLVLCRCQESPHGDIRLPEPCRRFLPILFPLVSSDVFARSKHSSDRRVQTGHGRWRSSQGLNMPDQPRSQKLQDEETGKNYFWNTETGCSSPPAPLVLTERAGETTWDSPLVEKTGTHDRFISSPRLSSASSSCLSCLCLVTATLEVNKFRQVNRLTSSTVPLDNLTFRQVTHGRQKLCLSLWTC